MAKQNDETIQLTALRFIGSFAMTKTFPILATRVLRVVYSFERGDLPIFVGQQMDVFICRGREALKCLRLE